MIKRFVIGAVLVAGLAVASMSAQAGYRQCTTSCFGNTCTTTCF
jgi:hypothetical protein